MSDGPRSPRRLTHLDETGAAHMVDVTSKDVTTRTATAVARVVTTAEVLASVRSGAMAKGDVLAVARIAGIMAAKRTPDLVPLCHPVAVHGVTVEVEVGAEAVEITTSVRTADRTGVEMEALTAATVAALTVYDMIKGVDRGATITDVAVTSKSGGRSGDWLREAT